MNSNKVYLSAFVLCLVLNTLLAQSSLLPLSPTLSTILSLGLLFYYLNLVVENFVEGVLFICFFFVLQFVLSLALLNATSSFHFGLVSYNYFTWPPPWAAAFWLMFANFLHFLLQKDFMKLFYMSLLITGLHTLFYIALEELDLLFFHQPKNKHLVLFSLCFLILFRTSTHFLTSLKRSN